MPQTSKRLCKLNRFHTLTQPVRTCKYMSSGSQGANTYEPQSERGPQWQYLQTTGKSKHFKLISVKESWLHSEETPANNVKIRDSAATVGQPDARCLTDSANTCHRCQIPSGGGTKAATVLAGGHGITPWSLTKSIILSPSKSLQFLFFSRWASSMTTQRHGILRSSGQSVKIISKVVMMAWNL